MKKAKIILTAIAVFAVLGGALAFKAKRTGFNAEIYLSTKSTVSIIGGFTYVTTVNSCVIDPLVFVNDGILDNTFVTSLGTITGFSAGNARTWREIICTTKNTLVTAAD